MAVYNGYVDQAGGLGMTVSAGGCTGMATAIGCTTSLRDPDDGESLALTLERRRAGPGAVSHVSLWYRPPGSSEPTTVGPPAGSPPTAPVPAVALPARLPPLPTGQLNAWVAPEGPAVAEVPGSVLIAAPGPCACASRGWSAVFRVTGDPDQVLARYVEALGGRSPVVARRRTGRRLVRVARLGMVPVGAAELRTVTTGDGVTWLLLVVARA